MKPITFILLLMMLAFSSTAQVSIARLFSDHVVLQRQKPIPVWGWAKAGETITVSLANQTLSTKTDTTGKWKVTFLPMEAGGAYIMTVTAPSGTLIIKDILVGEVWFCSGQSNMEWSVAAADNFKKEQKNADFPKIRQFYVQHDVQLIPQNDLKTGNWTLCTLETVGNFTAIGFFFARAIHQNLNIPIGLVHTSWGGSQIEGWISKEAMLENEALKPYAQNLPTNWQLADALHDKKVRKKCFGNPDFMPTIADEKKYLLPNYNFSKWQSGESAIGQWDWKGIWAFRGQGYMARNVVISPEMVNQVTTLGLGINDSFNEIYINGKLVSAGIIKGLRKITVPANSWQSGDNQLVIKFGAMSEPSWYGLGVEGKPEDFFINAGKEPISLTNGWQIMPSFTQKYEYVHSSNNIGTTIFNGMIAPLIPFAMRGTLWYQGESNAERAHQYRQTFPMLINDWRARWKDEFSFYFVQLSTYGDNQSSNRGSNWAELREAQTMALALPKTGMVVTTDIGNSKDIHPTNKQDVAKRLAALALKLNYGKDTLHSSPIYESMQLEGAKATISFKYIGKGLTVKDKFGYLKGFEVAADDKVFHYAKAEIIENRVVVTHPKGQNVVAVRYAWADAPEDANLFSIDGFPACPFRTDDWKGITVGKKFE
jgi:sialate O-acetylesterase